MTVIMPGTARPTNLHLKPSQLRMHVEGDLYHICDRLGREVPEGDRLYVVVQEDSPEPYVIMERCEDGFDRICLRTAVLDDRVIKRLCYIHAVPITERLRQHEAQEDKDEAEAKENELEELYERMGGAMYRQLHHDGFAHGRAESFAKAGPKVEASRSAKR